MICVTVGRGRHSSLLEEWEAAAAAGVDLVELRLDCLRRDPDLTRILAHRFTPVVITIRRGSDGGLWKGDEEKRQKLLREAIVMGVDYVDLEMDIASKIRRYGKTKRIVSYHNLKKTPDDLASIAEQCDEMDADVVKVATLAQSLGDASRILEVGSKSPVPTITIGMGDLGVFTRILTAKFGAPFTYAGFNPERTFAPGMLHHRALEREYFFNQIDRDTEVYAVIGDPIGHSLSPAIHNAAFRHLGLNKVMVPILVPNTTLERSLKLLKWLDIKGFSVTIPHKEALAGLVTEKDEAVDRTGAANTLIERDGVKRGYNTDYRAALDSIEQALPDRTEEIGDQSRLFGKNVLILGAGGVARTIAFGLSRLGANVTITNRHDERAIQLAEEVGARTIGWNQRMTATPDVLVNGTPVGMHPHVDDTPMPPGSLMRPEMLVFDTIYHPENTMLIKLAREGGCKTVTGVDMFVNQAAEQFRLYTGQEPPRDVMRQALRDKLGPARA